jgi:peptide chain release factor 1
VLNTAVTATSPETIPPALLSRARDIALEHTKLTEKLANGFDTRAAKRIGECGPIVTALGEWDKANEVRHRLTVQSVVRC